MVWLSLTFGSREWVRVRDMAMVPVCVITFEPGNIHTVYGTLEEVQEKLGEGGMVTFTDTADREIGVNSENVTKVEPLPKGVERD